MLGGAGDADGSGVRGGRQEMEVMVKTEELKNVTEDLRNMGREVQVCSFPPTRALSLCG